MPGIPPRNRVKKYPQNAMTRRWERIGERGETIEMSEPPIEAKSGQNRCEHCGEIIDTGQEETQCWDKFLLDISL